MKEETRFDSMIANPRHTAARIAETGSILNGPLPIRARPVPEGYTTLKALERSGINTYQSTPAARKALVSQLEEIHRRWEMRFSIDRASLKKL